MAATARKERYQNRGTVYGNLAYDLDREVLRRELDHAGEARREKVQAAPRVRSLIHVQVRAKEQVSVLTVLGLLAAAGLAVLLLYSYVQMTVIGSSVASLQSELSSLESQNVLLTTQYQELYDLAAVKAAAEEAGMTKPSGSQVFYLDLSEGDSAVVFQQQEPGVLDKLLDSLNHGVYAAVEYFS